MADITMKLDDTLELDTIVKKSDISANPISDIKYDGSSTNDYDSFGIETHTEVFKPRKSGKYTITINGQKLNIEVVDPNTIPESVIHYWPFDEGSGSEVVDNIGSLNINLNGPTWISDSRFEGGTAPRWDRENDTATAGKIDQSTSLSWSVRCIADSLGEGSPTNRYLIAHNFRPHLLYNVSNNVWRFDDVDANPRLNVSESQSTAESDVERILIVRADESNTAELEVYDSDKNLIGSTSGDSPSLSNWQSDTTYIGHDGDNERLWGGEIDNIYWANKKWSDQERDQILSLY